MVLAVLNNKNVSNNPTIDELRQLTLIPANIPVGGETFTSEVMQTTNGAIMFTSLVRSRTAKKTYIVQYPDIPLGVRQQGIDVEKANKLIESVQQYLQDKQVIQLDRQMGLGADSLHCRLYITKPFARIAYMWGQTLYEAASSDKTAEKSADITSVYVPEWPERIIIADVKNKTTWILGTDYFGEAKKSFLRQAMYIQKQRGGLGLHAGSKELFIQNAQTKQIESVGFLLFGLSGTGKTTLTIHDHGLTLPEKSVIRQDDVVLLKPNGYCIGTEEGFFIKTEALNPKDQGVLYHAALHPHAVFENVTVLPNGDLDFYDYRYTTNGRGIVLRSDIVPDDTQIDLAKANKIIFITRRTDVVPGLAKLTPEQAALAFMLGESIETSAGDPTKAGQAKRSVGTNPFLVGPEADEGNRMMEILKTIPDMEAYLLNTGSIGQNGLKGEKGYKISIQDSTQLMLAIARNTITWQRDDISGYEIPLSMSGTTLVDLKMLDPREYYSADEYAKRIANLKQERRDWIKQFSGLDPIIVAQI